MLKQLSPTIWLVVISILFVFAFLIVLVGHSSAAPSGLPPRPTDVPTAVPTPVVKSYGAFIQLQVSGSYNPALLWTIVQWQDANDGWHNVDGWQGTLDDGSRKTWWVSPEDFTTGPFRWQVYAQKEGELLAASDSFYLPAQDRQVVQVSVVLPSHQ